MPKEFRIGDTSYQFPDNYTDDQVRDILTQQGVIKAPAPAPSGPRSLTDSAKEFVTEAWNKVDPWEQLKGMGTAILHPQDAAMGILNAQGGLALKAKQAFERGDYASGLRHSFEYMIPLLGPDLSTAGDLAAQGEYAKSAGQAAGIATNLIVGSKLKIPEFRVTPKFGRLNPTQAGALSYLETEGKVPVNAGTKTGSPFVRGMQKVTAYTPLGAPIAEESARATEDALRAQAQRLAGEAHPLQVTPEQAGADLTKTLTSREANFGKLADTSYSDFRTIEADPKNARQVQVGTKQADTGMVDAKGNPIVRNAPVYESLQMPVDVRKIKTQLRPIYDEMTQWIEPAKRNASAGYQAIRSILEGPDQVSASVAEAGLGGLKDLAREKMGRSSGLAKFMVPKLQDAIDTAVGGIDPVALDKLRRGRSLTSQQYGVTDVLKQLRTEPVELFNQMTYAQDAGINRLREVAKQAPEEMAKIGRAYLEKLFKQATAEGGFAREKGMLTQWQNLGPETKKLLFKDPRMIENLDKFFLGAKMIAENPNPSGSALVGMIPAQGAFLLNHPVLGTTFLLGGRALAKMLYSPRGAHLLTEGMKVGTSQARAAAIAGQILNLAGKDAQRMEFAPAQ